MKSKIEASPREQPARRLAAIWPWSGIPGEPERDLAHDVDDFISDTARRRIRIEVD